MKSLGVKHYRMSFSWTRLITDGRRVNEVGRLKQHWLLWAGACN
jgi:beta-glucosidase/6-phospho-beta-glucosidase/beta-galactosidase